MPFVKFKKPGDADKDNLIINTDHLVSMEIVGVSNRSQKAEMRIITTAGEHFLLFSSMQLAKLALKKIAGGAEGGSIEVNTASTNRGTH